jgi:hypothetical protein
MMKRREMLNSLLALIVVGAFGGLSLEASAKRGRRASPNSVGGARRRTRRRRSRRLSRNMRLSSLPYGCSVRRSRGGVSYYYCSGIWYQPAYQGTTVVYIVNEIEPGASAEVEFEYD